MVWWHSRWKTSWSFAETRGGASGGGVVSLETVERGLEEAETGEEAGEIGEEAMETNGQRRRRPTQRRQRPTGEGDGDRREIATDRWRRCASAQGG